METYFFGIQSLQSDEQPFVLVLGYKKTPMDELMHLGMYVDTYGNIISVTNLTPSDSVVDMASALKKEAKEMDRHVKFTKRLTHIREFDVKTCNVDILNVEERGIRMHIQFTIKGMENFLFSYLYYKDDNAQSIPYVTYKSKTYRTARIFGDAEEIMLSKIQNHPKVRLKLLFS